MGNICRKIAEVFEAELDTNERLCRYLVQQVSGDDTIIVESLAAKLSLKVFGDISYKSGFGNDRIKLKGRFQRIWLNPGLGKDIRDISEVIGRFKISNQDPQGNAGWADGKVNRR